MSRRTQLKFGFTDDGWPIPIADVSSGRSHLRCPYCQGLLTAKKGRIKDHHFAHTDTPCQPVEKRDVPQLPYYDRHHLMLTGKEYDLLKLLWLQRKQLGFHGSKEFKRLAKRGFLRCIDWKFKQYRFTEKGKIPVGALPLGQFVEFQEPKLLAELHRLERAADNARCWQQNDLAVAQGDLALYRAQYRRILQQQLYFLQIQTDEGVLHKIGVTARAIAQRVEEIERDLSGHYNRASIKILGIWAHRGNVELYFKHRYRSRHFPIGTLTEYFQFNRARSVWRDLQSMPTKVLHDEEKQLLV